MATADVVVVGAGLSGLTAAIALAHEGARVEVVARGNATTHWMPGGFDCGSVPGAASPSAAVEILEARAGHPYALLAPDLERGLAFLRGVLKTEGLVYSGDLDGPLRAVPTAIGGTRRVGIVPDAQAAAMEPWAARERLVVCGIAGFKDFSAGPMVASLRRASVWGGDGLTARPARIEAVEVELPDQKGRRNINALELGRGFDDRAWRRDAFERISRAVESTGRGPGRIGLPAVLGIAEHAAVLDDARRFLPLPPFEVPLVPPSLPGVRLYGALRAALLRRGGRLSIGEPVVRIETDGTRATAVVLSAAVRERRVRAGAIVLATGGIAGGGLIGRSDGRLEEPLLGLPVESPAGDDWLADEAFPAEGHPLELAGIRTDAELRPVDSGGRSVFENVRVVGGMLAGHRAIRERSGDGVAIASGWRAAQSLRLGRAESERERPSRRGRRPAAATPVARP